VAKSRPGSAVAYSDSSPGMLRQVNCWNAVYATVPTPTGEIHMPDSVSAAASLRFGARFRPH